MATLPTSALDPVERRATASLIADAVRQAILDGRFEPGTQLTEAQLAEQLGVSRGPVREALQRLIEAGVLESRPHRGVRVVELDDADVADVYDARAVIERAAACRIGLRGDVERIDQLEALVGEMAERARSGTWDEVADVDVRFHEALVAGAESPRLTRAYETLLFETRLSLRVLPATYPDPSVVVDEHREVVAALRSGDEAKITAAIDQHLTRAAARR